MAGSIGQLEKWLLQYLYACVPVFSACHPNAMNANTILLQLGLMHHRMTFSYFHTMAVTSVYRCAWNSTNITYYILVYCHIVRLFYIYICIYIRYGYTILCMNSYIHTHEHIHEYKFHFDRCLSTYTKNCWIFQHNTVSNWQIPNGNNKIEIEVK